MNSAIIDGKNMKPAGEMIEGPEALARFKDAMKTALSVPHSEIQRRIEAQRKDAAKNPNRRGPKPKRARS